MVCKGKMKDKAEKKFKVLCLHGYGDSGAYLKMQLQVWPSNVLETMDFVFIDAPFPTQKKPFGPFPAFYWFKSSPEVQNLLQHFFNFHC